MTSLIEQATLRLEQLKRAGAAMPDNALAPVAISAAMPPPVVSVTTETNNTI